MNTDTHNTGPVERAVRAETGAALTAADCDEAAALLLMFNTLDDRQASRLSELVTQAGSLGELVDNARRTRGSHQDLWAAEEAVLHLYGYASEWATILDVTSADIDNVAGRAAEQIGDGNVGDAGATITEFLEQLIGTLVEQGHENPEVWGPIAVAVVDLWHTNPLWPAPAASS